MSVGQYHLTFASPFKFLFEKGELTSQTISPSLFLLTPPFIVFQMIALVLDNFPGQSRTMEM